MEKDVKYKSTLKNVVQDEDHIQFDFEHTPIDVPPKNNEKRFANRTTRNTRLNPRGQNATGNGNCKSSANDSRHGL